MRIEKIADELETLQAEKNSGRGVSCVRTAVVYLRRGDVEKAVACCHNEWDKIRSYPDIADFVIDHVLGENPDKVVCR